MGQTNINVKQHFCSKCRNLRAIHDFPHPKVVWWCRDCYQKFRQQQNERRRQKRQEALREYFSKRRTTAGWRVARYKSKGGLAALSPSQRQNVQSELNILVARCRRRGIPLTQKKIASLWANAIHIVKNVRTGKMRSWVSHYYKRRKRWERLQVKKKTEEFKARPFSQRCKVLSSG